jgi:hypothetical protein
VELKQVLDYCQAGRATEWRVIPGGDPGTDLLVGLVDAGTDDREPALTALTHKYRSVFVPDVRLGIGWGMDSEPTNLRRPLHEKPRWADPEWSGVYRQYAHVLFNGTMVWRVRYHYVDQGAGMGGYLPYFKQQFEQGPGVQGSTQGWDTTGWEVEFVRLLNQLNGTDFDLDGALHGFGLRIHEQSPLG